MMREGRAWLGRVEWDGIDTAQARKSDKQLSSIMRMSHHCFLPGSVELLYLCLSVYV